MNQKYLLDQNLYKRISRCDIKKKSVTRSEILVSYEDGSRERIWTYDPTRKDFHYCDFLGKTKIEAVFYCDRTRNSVRSRQ